MRFHGGVSRWFSKQQTCSLDNIGGVEELNSYLLLTVQYDKLPHNYKLVLIVTSEHLIQMKHFYNTYIKNAVIIFEVQRFHVKFLIMKESQYLVSFVQSRGFFTHGMLPVLQSVYI